MRKKRKKQRKNLDAAIFGAEGEAEVNPMDSVGNLSDVMLVLVVGLMLALINLFEVDLMSTQKQVEVEVTQEVPEEQQEQNDETSVDESGDYTQYGTVYIDENGNMVLVTDN